MAGNSKMPQARTHLRDAPLPVDANVPVVSMPVGVSQDLSKILALWSFLTSSITSPGKPFTVVSTVL